MGFGSSGEIQDWLGKVRSDSTETRERLGNDSLQTRPAHSAAVEGNLPL